MKKRPADRPSRNIYIHEKVLPDQLTKNILQKHKKAFNKGNQTDIYLECLTENTTSQGRRDARLGKQTHNINTQSCSSSEEFQITESKGATLPTG